MQCDSRTEASSTDPNLVCDCSHPARIGLKALCSVLRVTGLASWRCGERRRVDLLDRQIDLAGRHVSHDEVATLVQVLTHRFWYVPRRTACAMTCPFIAFSNAALLGWPRSGSVVSSTYSLKK